MLLWSANWCYQRLNHREVLVNPSPICLVFFFFFLTGSFQVESCWCKSVIQPNLICSNMKAHYPGPYLPNPYYPTSLRIISYFPLLRSMSKTSVSSDLEEMRVMLKELSVCVCVWLVQLYLWGHSPFLWRTLSPTGTFFRSPPSDAVLKFKIRKTVRLEIGRGLGLTMFVLARGIYYAYIKCSQNTKTNVCVWERGFYEYFACVLPTIIHLWAIWLCVCERACLAASIIYLSSICAGTHLCLYWVGGSRIRGRVNFRLHK